MHVGIVAQRHNDRAVHLAGRLREELIETGVAVVLDTATAEQLDVPGTEVDTDTLADCDLAVSIGGDGTFLYTARGAGSTPIVGVNLGEVGFLNAVTPSKAQDAVLAAVEALRADELDVQEAPRLAAHGPDWESESAVNEIVVQGPRRGHGGGVDVEISVDGAQYGTTHADGVLVATPTGSTAYNLSERGSLLHPDVEGLIVNPMCAVEGLSPLVVTPDSEIELALSGGERAVVVSDGRSVRDVDVPADVRIRITDSPVRIAGPDRDFFEALGKLE